MTAAAGHRDCCKYFFKKSPLFRLCRIKVFALKTKRKDVIHSVACLGILSFVSRISKVCAHERALSLVWIAFVSLLGGAKCRFHFSLPFCLWIYCCNGTTRRAVVVSIILFQRESGSAHTRPICIQTKRRRKKNEIFRVHLGVERKRAVKDAQLLLLGYSSRSAKFLIRLSRHLGRRVQHARRPICLYMLRTRRSSIETRLNL